MARYKVSSPWTFSNISFGDFHVQEADITDTKTGDVFRDGASRVVDCSHPDERLHRAVKGKGGTTPFFGESAWSDAQRLASDLYYKREFDR
jgi:hypothetical protein